MNITTENIDEWCFRHLEKDLNDEERGFFENELKNNTALAQQVAMWKRTVIPMDSLTPVGYAFENSLLRYRNSFLLSLLELVLVGSFTFFIVSNPPKESAAIKIFNTQSPIISDSLIHANTDSVSSENVRLTKRRHTNLLFDQKVDSAVVSENINTRTVEVDTIMPNTNSVVPTLLKINQTDSSKIFSDTTLTKTKSSQKKNSTKRKYKGSRLLPINNDL